MKKKIIVETREEIYCDICGEIVSDGRHDGAGGTNYWGCKAMFTRGINREHHEYDLCGDCDEIVIEYIESLKKKGWETV